MGCDIHAHIEVKIKGKWQHTELGYLYGHGFNPRDGIEDIRFICWFDS